MTIHTHVPGRSSAAEKARLGRRARLLAGLSVAHNVVEAAVAISAGPPPGQARWSASVVEVSSGLIILWQFRHHLPE
jgi:hypothetical protein